jgi:hypothetical protein
MLTATAPTKLGANRDLIKARGTVVASNPYIGPARYCVLGPAQTTTPRKQRLRIVRRRDGYDHREAKLPLFVAPWRTIRPAKRRQLHTDGSLPLVGGRRHHGHSVSLASSWRRTVFELISQGLKSASFDPQKGHTPFWVCHLGCTKSAGRRLTPASTAAMRPWVRISIA